MIRALPFVALLFALAYSRAAQASACVWNSTTAKSWNDTSAWASCGGGFPGSDDTVQFDGSMDGDCTVNTDATVISVTISSGYAGTINQTSGQSLTTSGAFAMASGTIDDIGLVDVGTTFTMTGGTFLSGPRVRVGTNFAQSAGTFTSTANQNVTVGGNFTISGTAAFTAPGRHLVIGGTFTFSGGSFTHNSGRVFLVSAANQTHAFGSATFNNLFFGADPALDTVASGLVGWWKLDDTGTPSDDTTANANHLAYLNTPTSDQARSAPLFENARAYTFDLGDALELATVPAELEPSTWSASLWFRVEAIDDGNGGTGCGDNTDSSDLLNNGDNFMIRLCETGASGTTVAVTAIMREASTNFDACAHPNLITIDDRYWHHVVAVQDGTKQTVYLNGVKQECAAHGSSQSYAGTGYFRLAKHATAANNSYDFDGWLDDVRVYDAALTEQDVLTLFAGGTETGNAATHTGGGNLTVAGDVTLISGTLAGTSGFSVAGSWFNHGAYNSSTGTVTLNGTATGKSILSGGQRFGALTVNGSGGGWTLLDRLWTTGVLTISNGTLATGNFAVHTGGISQTGGTFTPGTSAIVMDSTGASSLSTTTSLGTVHIEPTFETNLAHYFKLDEGVGITTRDSANSGTGTLLNGPSWATSPANTSTAHDNAAVLQFDSLDDAVSFNYTHSTPVTITAWVYMTGNGENNFPRVVALPTMNMLLRGTDSNRLGFEADFDTDWSWRTVGGISRDTWQHVAVTWDGTSTPTLCMNGTCETGTVQTTGAGAYNSAGGSGTGYIGNRADGARTFAGYIDDVRIYNTALSTAQIALLAAGGYAGTGGGATVTLGANTTVSTQLLLHNGTLDTSTRTLTVSHASNTTSVKRGAGLTIGGAATTMNAGLTVDHGGTFTMNGTSGSLSVANNSSVIVNGSLVTSTGTATPKPTIKSISGTYTFSVGNSATATPTLNINGLAVQNTTTAGMFVNQTSGATTTFTRFDNIAFSAGTGNYLLQIAHNTLTLHANGLTFDTTGTNATYNVFLDDRNDTGNDVRMYIGGTCVAGDDDCEAHDEDDDDAGVLGTSFDGVPDDAGADGAVVQWLYRGYTDVGGTIEGFPSVAFSWNNFAIRGTYVLTNNTTGGDYLIKRDTDGALYHASATWMLPMGEDFKGRPMWIHDPVGDIYYVFVLSTANRVYKLRDDGNSFTLLATFDGGGTAYSPLSADSSYLYWTGTSAGVASALKLPQSTLTGVASVAVNAATAAPSLATVGATKYLFTAASGRAYKINTDFSPASETLLGITTVYGRVTVINSRVYFIDNSGMLWVLNSATMAQTSYYQDPTTHTSCSAGNNCEARNLYFDSGSSRVYFGDKDGHVYAVTTTTSPATPMWANPFNTGSNVFVNAPLYRSGVIAIGSTAGKVYFIDQRSTAVDAPAAVPTLIRTYSFGSVGINNISFDHDGNQYVIATSDGRLYYVHATLVDDGDAWD